MRNFFTPIRVGLCQHARLGRTTIPRERRFDRSQGVTLCKGQGSPGNPRVCKTGPSRSDCINRLASHQPSRRQLETYYESLYPDRANGQNHRAANIRSKLFELFENGIGQDMPAIRHTRPGRLQRRDRIRRSSPTPNCWSKPTSIDEAAVSNPPGLARVRDSSRRLGRSRSKWPVDPIVIICRFLAVEEIVRVSEKLPCKGPLINR